MTPNWPALYSVALIVAGVWMVFGRAGGGIALMLFGLLEFWRLMRTEVK